MAIQFNSLLLTSLSFLVIASTYFHVSSAGSVLKHNFLDDEQPINPNDPNVVGIAKFAVDEHNKEAKSNFELVNVLAGGTDSVTGGVVYQLHITATESDVTTTRLVAVLVHSDNSKQLLSFQ
ncbi:cysteine proteinase inhibitor 4-like [Lycium barbarum]|uniref:cysteine proteinase inhibitor 4-like n=1 Tax=Lycium barbarum TaxID=112863 RepID=UPI00293EF7BA|nr:cysteine proteinase inhibitor 4-like [Lycium barbarum]